MWDLAAINYTTRLLNQSDPARHKPSQNLHVLGMLFMLSATALIMLLPRDSLLTTKQQYRTTHTYPHSSCSQQCLPSLRYIIWNINMTLHGNNDK